jgi:hypothetical protein
MRQYYTKDIIVHGKGTVRRMQQMVVMNLKKDTDTDGNQM